MHTKTTNLCQYYVISMISVSISIFKKIINICNGLVMLIFFVFFFNCFETIFYFHNFTLLWSFLYLPFEAHLQWFL